MLTAEFVLAGKRLQSRVVMGSMHTGLEERGDWAAAARFYARRAEGGAGLIITGGMAPNREGAVFPGAAGLFTADDVANHRIVTGAVREAGGVIAMQILHAGRYARGADCVSASAIRSPISPFAPVALDEAGIEKQLADIATAAARAREAGYDGVEVMGSEGYFLNQFLAPRTNRREDRWGRSAEARRRLPVEVLRRVRAAVGRDFLVIYRISLADLVPEGSSWEEVVALAKALEGEVDAFTSGFGWHEARVPTIAASVPPGAFVALTARLKGQVAVPVVAANRINSVELAEGILARGEADLVALARPWLAEPDFVVKARRGEVVAPCIACNQACLDHTFTGRLATCLVNPAAAREAEFAALPAARRKRIAVVGGGAAGMACAATAAERGHEVTLFEAEADLGGQMRLAAAVPGKAEFALLIGWFAARLAAAGVTVRLGVAATSAELAGFDAVVLATGVMPRKLSLPGALDYAEVLSGHPVGERVAIIGAGGIGFDVATLLVGAERGLEGWRRAWGVGDPAQDRGGLTAAAPTPPAREVWLLQRKAERPGKGLGKTTGWIHRAHLAAKGVQMWGGVEYLGRDAQGLHLRRDGAEMILPVDDVVFCAGQDSVVPVGVAGHLIGGAREAAGLDASRAIEEGTRLGLKL